MGQIKEIGNDIDARRAQKIALCIVHRRGDVFNHQPFGQLVEQNRHHRNNQVFAQSNGRFFIVHSKNNFHQNGRIVAHLWQLERLSLQMGMMAEIAIVKPMYYIAAFTGRLKRLVIRKTPQSTNSGRLCRR